MVLFYVLLFQKKASPNKPATKTPNPKTGIRNIKHGIYFLPVKLYWIPTTKVRGAAGVNTVLSAVLLPLVELEA